MELAGCQVMAKPTGSVCNIDCTYCFYLEKEALYPERNKTGGCRMRHWSVTFASILRPRWERR